MDDLKLLRETRDLLLRQSRSIYGHDWERAQARRDLQSVTAHIAKLERARRIAQETK